MIVGILYRKSDLAGILIPPNLMRVCSLLLSEVFTENATWLDPYPTELDESLLPVAVGRLYRIFV